MLGSGSLLPPPAEPSSRLRPALQATPCHRRDIFFFFGLVASKQCAFGACSRRCNSSFFLSNEAGQSFSFHDPTTRLILPVTRVQSTPGRGEGRGVHGAFGISSFRLIFFMRPSDQEGTRRSKLMRNYAYMYSVQCVQCTVHTYMYPGTL